MTTRESLLAETDSNWPWDVWSQTWFEATSAKRLVPIRVGIGILASIQFVMYLCYSYAWLGPVGMFPTDVSLHFIGDGLEELGSQYRWSVLFDYPSLVSMVSAIGLVAAIGLALGIGSRLAPAIAWLSLAQFHHRAPFLVELHEPILAILLLYLVIHPGSEGWMPRKGCQWQDRVFATISLRLIQSHFWIWGAFVLASMISRSVWWNGDAGWILAQRSSAWLQLSEGMEWVGQLMTHLIVISLGCSLICLMQDKTRSVGQWVWLVFVLCVLLLTGQWMYAAVLLVWSQAYWPIPPRLSFLRKKSVP
jgi:hypothetical protein